MKKYSFHFVDFRIVNLNFGSNLKIKPDKDISVSSRIDIGYNINGKELNVFLKLEIEEGGLPFNLNLEGDGLFKFDHEVDPDQIEEIANINCAAIIFPYLRETVADITRRAGFPPLHLPPVNFVEIYKRQKEDAS